MRVRRPGGRLAVILAMLAGTGLVATSCDEFLTVDHPNVIDATTITPLGDAETFSLSARQNFAVAYGWAIMLNAWFVGEARVADTYPRFNEFGLRRIQTNNLSLGFELWQPLQVARASADRVRSLVTGASAEARVHLARAALFSGYVVLMIAESFCQGTINGGPALTTAQLLDSALVRFSDAVTNAAAGGSTGEAVAIAGAAHVGRARAYLQAGQKAQAATEAGLVPAGFVYAIEYADDLANRVRLGNRLWEYTLLRGSIAVAPAFQRLNDPRVVALAPSPEFPSQDGLTDFWTQGKYRGFDTPIRLASKIEADYIAAEASGASAMLGLIASRRAANGLPAYAGPTDAASVLTELMEQRGREFYLEGKRVGDYRRNSTAVLHVPPARSPYHKPGYDIIGDQTCYPLPAVETQNNPNFH